MTNLNPFERAVAEHQRREGIKSKQSRRNRPIQVNGSVTGSLRELKEYASRTTITGEVLFG